MRAEVIRILICIFTIGGSSAALGGWNISVSSISLDPILTHNESHVQSHAMYFEPDHRFDQNHENSPNNSDNSESDESKPFDPFDLESMDQFLSAILEFLSDYIKLPKNKNRYYRGKNPDVLFVNSLLIERPFRLFFRSQV